MRFLLISLLVLSFSFALDAQNPIKYSKVKLHLHDHDLKAVTALGLETDHGSHAHHKHLINVFDERELNILDEAGISYDVIIEDVQTFYNLHGTTDQDYVKLQTRNGNCVTNTNDKFDYDTPVNYSYGTMGGYLTYEEALAEMDKMADMYPNLITERMTIASIVTHENRNLYYMVISNSPNAIDTNKPQILYNSLHHAREPNSLSQNIFYMWYLLENYGTNEEVTYLVDNTTMFFFPIVNPDGYVWNETTNPNGGGFWRKNRYVNPAGDVVGVDLNRNYGFFWGFDDQGSSNDEQSQVYRGPGPFSEPETQAMRQLFLDNNFLITLNYHTFGNLLIHPWGYSDQPTDEDAAFKSLARVMTTDNDFLIGTGTETVGYVVNGDSDDWMYGEQTEKEKSYAMTPEVGPAFWPSEDQIDGLNKTAVRHNLNAAHLLLNFGWAKELSPANEITGDAGTLSFQFEKSGLQAGTISFSVQSETAGFSLSANEYPNLLMNISETMDFEVNYTVDPGFAENEVDLVMLIDNGNYAHRIPFKKSYSAGGLEPDNTSLDPLDNSDNFVFGGDWSLTEEDFVSSPFSITDSPNSNYSNNTSSEIILVNPLNLMNVDSAFFKFHTKFEIENDYDYVQLKVSVDGVNYEAICGNYTNASVPDQLPIEEPLYDGFQSEWVQETICLNQYVGNENVYLKFTFFADQGVREDGFYFDDLIVEQFTGTTMTTDIIDLTSIQIAPNPSHDQIRITLNDQNNMNDLSFEIYNLTGRKIMGAPIRQAMTQLNVEQIMSGSYFINLKQQGKIISTTKWIKL